MADDATVNRWSNARMGVSPKLTRDHSQPLQKWRSIVTRSTSDMRNKGGDSATRGTKKRRSQRRVRGRGGEDGGMFGTNAAGALRFFGGGGGIAMLRMDPKMTICYF